MSSRPPAPARARAWLARRWDLLAVAVGIVAPVAVVAVALHRRGQGWGDDFALYLRQARSLVDGNVGQVIADNHVNVDSAALPGFSPYVYPWSFPVLLAPFVRLWGFDVDRLKLVEVACWCAFLACWYGVLRRRMRTWMAWATTAAAGWSLVYLRHSDSILSELPYMAALAATLWYADRIRAGAPRWDAVDRRRLIALGVAMMVVFNVRREGLAIVPALLAMQLADVLPHRRERVDWRPIATPHLTFVAAVLGAQLALPSALAPEYAGAGLGQTWRKLQGPFQDSFVEQLGFDRMSRWLLLLVVALAIVGALVRLRRHLAEDVGILVLALGSATIAGMIPANSSRYTMAVTPLVAYFVVQAAASVPRTRHVGGALVAGTLLVANWVDIPGAIADARDFDARGAVVAGALQPASLEMFAAVRRFTHRDDLVGFFKARALTLYTDRRAVQSKDLSIILERADFFVMGHSGSVGVPILSDAEARAAGLVEVWSNEAWTLFRVPDPNGAMLNP